MTGTYSKKHEEWDDTDSPETKSEACMISAMFGSCSGVIDAATEIFTSAERSQREKQPEEQPKQKLRRSKSPSIRKSGQVLEIPEYLSADIIEGNNEGTPGHDDVSALSSFTLDEMARQKLIANKNKFLRRTKGVLIAENTNGKGEKLFPPRQKYIKKYEMTSAPLSGMLVRPPANPFFVTGDGGSVSSLGSSSFRQTYPLMT
mmetsp:Transcript_41002/g.46578  ORF Transcript_41002/g.46578 Transcript_41002/m.46578 type:complete len:203 (+) Transcript_41002:196-804(+)|eukprot:CAMPEP_0194133554 /NCGR_PEP_ID=MMETSP0152-20130528/3679_1 /TAXON_ID=1049557 /ORGANISM="Thalassiothrix antarctica, Strain L6-D1" /LENGTH=202 /DNA_ID=CAMNT_0038828883 /DNA_START=173 /DNA_END=781 /DNA_ORIENTATION=+